MRHGALITAPNIAGRTSKGAPVSEIRLASDNRITFSLRTIML
jgi:hypothetical protein